MQAIVLRDRAWKMGDLAVGVLIPTNSRSFLWAFPLRHLMFVIRLVLYLLYQTG